VQSFAGLFVKVHYVYRSL